MTTIAYRNGVLAADRQMTAHTHRDGYVTKIRKRGEYLAGAAGTWAFALRFLDWFQAGLPEAGAPNMGDEKDGGIGRIFCPGGLILRYSNFGWERQRANCYAFGSGCDYAYGAMSMGATAEEAVKASLVWETTSGGPIDVLRHFP